MTRTWLAFAVLCACAAVACLAPDSVTCADGTVCPAGTVCIALTDPPQDVCAGSAQMAACSGMPDHTPCMYDDRPDEECIGGVCILSCGDGVVRSPEVCDDSNTAVGDGCSQMCLSDETCGNLSVDRVKLAPDGSALPNEECDDGGHLGHDGCEGTCRLEVEAWQPVDVTKPHQRHSQGMVYDAARGRVLMVGGGDTFASGAAPNPLDDVLEWDGRWWVRIGVLRSAPARFGAAVAYDARRHRVVVFGGIIDAASTRGDDTWEWDGTSWQRQTPAVSPARRSYAHAVYDGTRVVMTGGIDPDGNGLRETWAWDGTTWTQLAHDPAMKAPGGIAFDPVRGVIVAQGVQGGVATDNATWEFDGTSWHDVTPAAVGDRSPEVDRFAIAFDPIGKHIITLGGTTNDTWGWDGQRWTLLQAASGATPSARDHAVMVGDPARGEVILFGGTTGSTSYDQTYRWNGSSWTFVAPITNVISPAARMNAQGALDALRGRFVTFSGDNASTGSLDQETWEFDGGSWRLENPAHIPGARRWGTMTYDAARRVTVLFGGYGTSSLQDTWTWDGNDWTDVTPSMSPPARLAGAMAFDVARKQVVLFGGAGGQVLADTWLWNGSSWSLATPPASPPARQFATMGYDATNQRVVLYGGLSKTGALLSDAWAWDGTTWAPVLTTYVSPARQASAMAWNPARQSLQLFGGTQGITKAADTWALTNNGWLPEFPLSSPPATSSHVMAPLPDGSGVLAYSGQLATGAATAQLWQLRWTSEHPYELCAITADNDGDGLAGCLDPDCWYACAPLCPPGMPASDCDASPRCGDGACNAAVENCHNCPGDCSCTPVCGDTFCDPPEDPTSCPGDCP